ncbi:hypothetical protein BV898_19970 [Hypsibius exemplaris]|uniref:Uncharacterized protein n=1 Tax=Hypsibius exemplaris TaxID=2072580 RepID=A0A9X6NMF7_HYPEX|nr:hypothetical protein BV898_19970 [Hypsibius exemplaris]
MLGARPSCRARDDTALHLFDLSVWINGLREFFRDSRPSTRCNSILGVRVFYRLLHGCRRSGASYYCAGRRVWLGAPPQRKVDVSPPRVAILPPRVLHVCGLATLAYAVCNYSGCWLTSLRCGSFDSLVGPNVALDLLSCDVRQNLQPDPGSMRRRVCEQDLL